jgi:hypothetical protein
LRLLRVAAAAFTAVCAIGCAGPPESRRPGLLPDVGARPRLVALSVNSARRAALRNASLVTNLVNGLPASTRFLVLTNDPGAFSARDDRPGRVRFLDLSYESPITIWTQDPFLVLTGARGDVTLLASKTFERADDRLMADVVSKETGFPVRASGLSFEGGNIVSDTESIFVGATTIRRNAAELGVAEPEVVVRFEEELGRPVLVVGPFPQPIGHIDMAMTPLGDRRIAVADAAAGARIAERALRDAPGSVEAFERGCEEAFFGDPAIRTLAGADGALEAPKVRGRTREMIRRSWAVAPQLDGVARALEQHGYHVERIPFLFGGPEAEGREGAGAAYPMLTYNNVILEQDVEGRFVYLPRYGWPAMDEAARQAWAQLGFSPRPIDGLTISAMYGGALRCAVKVLAR